jgi:N-acetylglucosamine malate deacetylase 1
MKKKITRMLLKALGRAGKPYLQMVGLLKTSKVFNKSALVWDPGKEKVLVLAPHMDDEVIGCGGTLARHVQMGADITVVFLTDGRYGGHIPPGTSVTERQRHEQILVETRKDEARGALNTLGIHNIIFLDAEDGQLASTAGIAERLRTVLNEVRPQLVYVPFFLEGHPDHQAVSDVLLAASTGMTADFLCVGYEVWTPLFPNCFVNIDTTVELKRTALQHYKSQLAQADYMHTAMGLSAYRSNAFLGGTCRYAEAFNTLPLAQYLDLYRQHSGGGIAAH